MPVTLDDFLAYWGFHSHPFAAQRAGIDIATDVTFVRSPCFDWLLACCEDHESAIIFAGTGHGKTTLRQNIAVPLQLTMPVPLIITLDDFTAVLRSSSVTNVTIEDYLAVIRRLILERLAAQFIARPQTLALLHNDQHAYQDVLALTRHYVPLAARSLPEPPVETLKLVEANELHLGVRSWLNYLNTLVQAAGWERVICMVDCLDELDATLDPEQGLALLTPLLHAPWALHECGMTFVLFLSLALYNVMHERVLGRLDRTPHRVLTWDNKQLITVLNRRLEVASRPTGSATTSPSVHSFGELCALGAAVEPAICNAANGSPRRLLQLASQLIDQHLCHATTPSELLAHETIAAVLGDVELPQPQPEPLAGPPLFRLDRAGDIWIGAKRKNLNLPKNQRTILEMLWRAQPGRVSYHDLAVAVYGLHAWDRDVQDNTRETLQRMIKRLKITLEKDSSLEYIKLEPGHGYRLVNVVDS
jgi:hypothetical protein